MLPLRRFLALDYGEARIGVAASDDLGMLAFPVETVASYPRAEALRRIVEIVALRKSDTVVVGLPVRADGEEGSAAATVRKFAESLEALLSSGVRIVFQDEFCSTKKATEQLRAAGKRTRHHRPVIDQAAAVVILQDYLDERQAGATVLPEME